jgi:hypothetical protein
MKRETSKCLSKLTVAHLSHALSLLPIIQAQSMGHQYVTRTRKQIRYKFMHNNYEHYTEYTKINH